jgi:hypothetical protein
MKIRLSAPRTTGWMTTRYSSTKTALAGDRANRMPRRQQALRSRGATEPSSETDIFRTAAAVRWFLSGDRPVRRSGASHTRARLCGCGPARLRVLVRSSFELIAPQIWR